MQQTIENSELQALLVKDIGQTLKMMVEQFNVAQKTSLLRLA